MWKNRLATNTKQAKISHKENKASYGFILPGETSSGREPILKIHQRTETEADSNANKTR